MGSTSIFSSSTSEQRWTDQIRKHFEEEVKINITPVCVFHVPKTITANKPEAYLPQRIGLGPYHHFQPELYQSEREKLAAATQVLKADQIANFQPLVVDKLKEEEPIICACYDRYLDFNGYTLAWVIAIDGLFLLHHLGTYGHHIVDLAHRKSAQDIMMVENQIPFILLEKIRKAIQTEKVENKYYSFCEAHSPLKLSVKTELLYDHSHVHLLDLMYHLIVNRDSQDLLMDAARARTKRCMRVQPLTKNLKKGLDIAANHVGGQAKLHIDFIRKLPWEEICGLFSKSDENKTQVEEIIVPSVSNLHKIAGVKFKLIHRGGIREIMFDEETLTLYLPVITLHVDSEVILRNLVAYEALAMPAESTLEIAEYIDLMCGIIDNVEDVRLLRAEKIIEGDLNDDQIVHLFNGIRKSTVEHDDDNKSKIEKAIDDMNKRYDSRPRVKAYEFIKKCGYGLWKFLTYASYVVLLLLLILQAFCNVYGCNRRWWSGESSTLDLRIANVSSFFLV